MPKLLITLGIVLIAFGLVWLAGERLGLGRLPGDIVIERENFRFYLLVTTSLLISLGFYNDERTYSPCNAQELVEKLDNLPADAATDYHRRSGRA